MRKRRQFLLRANNFGSVDNGLIFGARLQNSLVPYRAAGSPTPTFTRATTAFVTDFEGLLKPVLSGEARFMGARRVRNMLATPENISAGGGWTITNATVSSGVSDPNGGTSAFTLTATGANGDAFLGVTTVVGNTYLNSIWMRRRTGTGNVLLYKAAAGAGDGVNLASVLTSSWQRFSVAAQAATGTTSYLEFRCVTSGDAIDVWHPQLEDVTGQSNQNPSEYVSVGVLSAPYHGANVDGVAYKFTLNGNTVSSNVVTEATGSPITNANSDYADASGPYGYLAEGARTNLALQSQTFGNASWTKAAGTSVTANSTVSPDGTATADTITETGAGSFTNYVYQSVAATADVNYAGTLFAKYVDSPWVMFILTDGTNDVRCWFNIQTGAVGSNAVVGTGTFTSATISAAANGFYRLQLVGKVNGGSTSIRHYHSSASGDASTTTVAGNRVVWGAQFENNVSFASSYIPTTTASVTRNIDNLTYPLAGNLSNTVGSTYAEVVIPNSVTASFTVLVGGASTYALYISAPSKASIYDGTNDALSPAFTGSSSLQKLASKWSSDGIKAFSGGTAGTGANFDGDLGIVTIGIGATSSGASAINGTIRFLNIYNHPRSDAYWTARTTP